MSTQDGVVSTHHAVKCDLSLSGRHRTFDAELHNRIRALQSVSVCTQVFSGQIREGPERSSQGCRAADVIRQKQSGMKANGRAAQS